MLSAEQTSGEREPEINSEQGNGSLIAVIQSAYKKIISLFWQQLRRKDFVSSHQRDRF